MWGALLPAMRNLGLSISVVLLTSCCGGGTSTAPAATQTVVATPPAPVTSGVPVPQWIWGDVAYAEHASFVNDDTLVVVADGGASMIDVATGQVRAFLPESSGWGRHVRPSRDGHAVLDGASDWSLDDGSALQLPGSLRDALWSDESPIVDSYVLAGAQRFVVMTRMDQTLADAEGHVVAAGLGTSAFASRALDPTGRTILVLGSRTEIRAASNGAVRATAEGRWSRAAYTDDGARVLLARDGALQVIDAASGETIAHAEGLGTVLGVTPNAAWALFASSDRVQLVDGTTLAVAAEGPRPSLQRVPVIMSSGGAFVSDGGGEHVLHDLRAGTHVALAEPLANTIAIDAHATRVLVQSHQAMMLLDPNAPSPVWSVPLHGAVPIDTFRLLGHRILVSSQAGTWVLDSDGSRHRWSCEEGYPRRQQDGSVWISCLDGSAIDATTGELRTPAGGTVDPCVYDSRAEMMGEERECDDEDGSEAASLEEALVGITVELGSIARITHGADVISIGLYETSSEVALAVWDEHGRGTDTGGMLLVRDAGSMRGALRTPVSADLVAELFAHLD